MASRLTVTEKTRQRLGEWYSGQVLDSTTVLQGSLAGWIFGRFGQHAVTLNKTVHLTPQAPQLDTDSGIVLLGHELYHVGQQHEMGWWRFLASYILRWRPSHIKRGWEHSFEIPAYARSREIRQKLDS